MKVSYRIVEEATPGGEWETVGVITFWHDDPPHMQLRGMLQHTVSRSIWGKIRQRVIERHLTLETYHEAIEEYSPDYRILPEIHHLAADTAAEIRHWLREKYVFLKEPAPSP
jgi:hypothetical protein